jgi:hypothetical protein
LSADVRRDGVRDRVITAVVLAFAVLVPLYIGFRLPNAWSATLDAVSLTDGFHRRIVVGTLLRPLALATDFNYWLFASFSYLVLGALLGALVRHAWRTPHLERRLLVIAWLVLPTGAFLFNEVGYFEQVLYLFLLASMWCVNRERIAAATALMCVTPWVHEIAILTVIPLFGVLLLRAVPPRHAVLATAIPALVNLAVFLVPPASSGAIEVLARELQQANFQYRPDALEVFARSQADHWTMYSVHEVVVYVRPVAYVLIALFVALWFSDPRSWRNERDTLPGWVILVASCAAIAVTSLLAYGGWDGNRWRFLVITNFFFVVWLALGHRRHGPLRASTIAVMLFSALLVSRMDIWYFDRLAPRELGYRPIAKFIVGIGKGTVFRMANE